MEVTANVIIEETRRCRYFNNLISDKVFPAPSRTNQQKLDVTSSRKVLAKSGNEQSHSRLVSQRSSRGASRRTRGGGKRVFLHKTKRYMYIIFLHSIYIYIPKRDINKSLCLRAEKASFDRRINRTVRVRSVQIHPAAATSAIRRSRAPLTRTYARLIVTPV